MKIITNNKLIKRNKLIGQITTFASMGILGLGLYLSFKQTYITWSFAALLAGFLLSQFGIYYGSRWGRSPRPDEQLNQALKGLDNKYLLYHYCSPVAHLLLGPAGIWILAPYSQSGTITYDENKNRWKQKGGNLYMKVFAQDGLGRPDLEIEGLQRSMQKFVKKLSPAAEFPGIDTALIFTNEKTEINIGETPIPTLHAKKIKEFIRRKAKENVLNPKYLELLENNLPKE